jgi:hypothetical protein
VTHTCCQCDSKPVANMPGSILERKFLTRTERILAKISPRRMVPHCDMTGSGRTSGRVSRAPPSEALRARGYARSLSPAWPRCESFWLCIVVFWRENLARRTSKTHPGRQILTRRHVAQPICLWQNQDPRYEAQSPIVSCAPIARIPVEFGEIHICRRRRCSAFATYSRAQDAHILLTLQAVIVLQRRDG